jgi:phage-related protein
MAEMDESIRVSLNLEVNDPNVDLDSLDKLTAYFDEIYKASIKVNEAMKKALDMGSVNPNTLKAYEEQINSIKKAFEKVKQIKTDAIQNAYDSFDVGGTTNISVLSDAVDKLNRKFDETADKLKKAETGFKKLQTNAKITSAAPNLTNSADTQKQVEQVAQATNKVASSTSKTVSASAKACANTVSKALNTIGNVGERVFIKIGKAGLATFKTITIGMTNALVHPISNLKNLESVLLKPFKSLNSLLPQVSMGIRGVTSGLLALGGVAGLILLGKQAVSAASDLEEVQNVVDVVFAGMSDDIENFTTKMAGAFGESELQAKKFTSTFGSMFNSVGVANDKILIMSENMSALAGDMASFYNIPLEQAFQKIQSGLAGEAEPLRQLGINMNQTAIEAWAMTQGITTSFNKLSTSEQTILRYNYLLAMTANAHGDFTRTQLSWANSCRQIALNVQTIFVALGNIVKAALTPVLTMINYVTSALARLLTLVGARFKSTTQTASSGMSNLNSQISDASKGLGKVADSATKAGKAAEAAGKKAKLGLASFDQLNNLNSQPSDAGSSGGSGAGAGGGAGAGASAGAGMDINPNSYIEGIEWTDNNPLTQWMNKFYETLTDGRYAKAGEMCSKAITTGLKKVENALDSKSLYTKIDNTNMALSNFLRGLVSDQNMWTQLGNTIGSGINIIAFSINNLYDNLTANSVLSSFGQGIASTINASLEKTDWASVGMALTTGIRSGIDIAFNAIMNTDFTSLGTALKNGCSGAISRVFDEGGAAEIGGIIAGSLNGAFDTVVAWLGDGTVATKLGEGIKTSINTAINNLDVESMGSALTAMLSSATNIMAELRGIDFNQLLNKIVESINTAIENGSAEDFLTSAIGLVGDILSALIEALPQIDWGTLIKELKNAISKTIDEHPELAEVGIKFLAALGIAKALQGIDLGSMLDTAKLTSSLDGVSKSLDKLGETKALSSLGSSLASTTGQAGGLSGALAGAEGSAGGLSGALGGLGGVLGGLLGPIAIIVAVVGAFIGTFIYLWNTSSTFREEIDKIKDKLDKDLKPVMDDMKESLQQIGDFLLNVWDVIANLLEPFIVGITAILADIYEGIMKIVGGIVDVIAGIVTLDPDKIMKGLGKIFDGIMDLFKSVGDGCKAFFDDIWAKIGGFVDDVVGKIADFFSDLWTKFKDGMATIGEKVSDGIDNVVKFFKDLPGNVKEKVDDFVSKVKDWFGKVPDNIKEAFKDVADIGKNLVEGVWNGINDKVDWIVKKVKGFGDKVMKGLKDFFGIHSPSRLMRDEIGIYLGEGIGVGIEDSAKYAVTSATQMGSDVMSAVSDSVDPDALKFADMKLSLADVYKTDNLDTVLQNYNTQMDSLVSKAQAFRDAMNEVSGKYSLDTLKVLLGDYRKVNSGDDTTPQRVVIAGQERVVAVSGMSEGVSANEVMSIVNDNARRF